MNTSIAATVATRRERAGSRARADGQFFTTLGGLMLVVNLVGFAPTYFLKGYFAAPELPLRTHFHGALFTAWFVLFLVQTVLVSRRKTALHRRLGVGGAVLACLMATSGLAMLYYRALEVQLTGEDAMRSLIGTSTVVWGNLALLAAFSCFAALGIYFRRRPEAHKRLMLLASMSMMLQAVGRIGRFPALPGSEISWALGGLLVLLISLVLFDVVAHRRLHPVTLWGPPLLFVSIVLCSLVVPQTGVGQALILMLAS